MGIRTLRGVKTGTRLLDKLRATPPRYKRDELLASIEQSFGRGFAKLLREQLETETLRDQLEQEKSEQSTESTRQPR